MYLAGLFLGLISLLVRSSNAEQNPIAEDGLNNASNTTANNTDMYVVHAIVYQVGILTNRTDDELNSNNFTGKQEAITFYHNEGSNLDLSKIRNPLLTNVTAQDVVGISKPTEEDIHFNGSSSIWVPHNSSPLTPRGMNSSENMQLVDDASNVKKRSLPVQIINGTNKTVEEMGIKSIGIPPLLVLNKKFSNIPVPIPNTSVISYAKVNTVVHSP